MRATNKVWQYFDKSLFPHEKKALCLLCQGTFSYITSTGNLRSHLKKMHPNIAIDDEEEPITLPPPQQKESRSKIWEFFTKLDDHEDQRTASCKFCYNVYKYTTTSGNLRKHLSTMHADLFPPKKRSLKQDITNEREKRKRYSEDGEGGEEEVVEMDDDEGEELDESEEGVEGDKREDKGEKQEFQEAEDSTLDLQNETEPVDLESSTTPLVEAGKQFKVWEYFTKTGDWLAKCAICSNNFSYKTSTGNLKSHLYSVHSQLFPGGKKQYKQGVRVRVLSAGRGAGEDADSADESPVYLEETSEDDQSKPLWRFFERLGGSSGATAARCRLCRGAFDYDSVGLLRDHLKKFHLQQYLEYSSLADGAHRIEFLDTEVEGEDQLPSTSLASVFRTAGSGARCTLCGERVGRREHDLRDHLATCHPKIVEEIEDSNSSTDRNNPLQDVDDGELIRRLRGSPSPPRRRSRGSSRREERRQDRREERRNSPDTVDEISSFLVYLGTLLRGVPRESSARLQADVVALVARRRAELDHEKKAAAANVVSSPKYIITIPSTSQGVPGGVKEILISKDGQGAPVQGELVTLIQTDHGMGVTEGEGTQVREGQGEKGTSDVHME